MSRGMDRARDVAASVLVALGYAWDGREWKAPPLEIVQEVPGVHPQWFVSGIVKHFRADSAPSFESREGAVAFCEAIGRSHITKYFEP